MNARMKCWKMSFTCKINILYEYWIVQILFAQILFYANIVLYKYCSVQILFCTNIVSYKYCFVQIMICINNDLNQILFWKIVFLINFFWRIKFSFGQWFFDKIFDQVFTNIVVFIYKTILNLMWKWKNSLYKRPFCSHVRTLNLLFQLFIIPILCKRPLITINCNNYLTIETSLSL